MSRSDARVSRFSGTRDGTFRRGTRGFPLKGEPTSDVPNVPGDCPDEMSRPAESPWGLTPRQIEVLDALVELGCNKLVARKLGLSLPSVEYHMVHAGRRMTLSGNRVLMAVWWDRWRRGEDQE